VLVPLFWPEIENPHGQWNRMEVLCDGDKVSIKVNGNTTLTGTNAAPQAGKIRLQTEGRGYGTRRHFRTGKLLRRMRVAPHFTRISAGVEI
jgi:Domain of Unknown Function (DUF1080)